MGKNEIIRIGGNGRRSTYVIHGGLMYISGITSVMLEGDMREQAADVLGQIDRLLARAGTDKNRVLSATVYLRSMEDYPDFNAIWDAWVSDGHEPARTSVEAAMSLNEYRLKVSVIAAV
ncbi:MAG: RidA family protein [Ruminococcaceae bacterium]|nr:RidA family protein [Oscillospiraceae bacterium]